MPITELRPSAPPDWIWPGFIARGYVTLFVGLWKTGKTTLINHLLHDVVLGGPLNREPVAGPVLVITEEPEGLWSARREELGLPESVHVLMRPFNATPGTAEWEDFAFHLADLVRTHGYSLIVFDTLPDLWPVYDENNAPEVQRALRPLHLITDAGAALLLVHHARKGGGTEAQATRGSGALPGWVDMIVEFGRLNAEDLQDRRRVLKTYGRLEDIEPETVIELREDGYHVIGNRAHATKTELRDQIRQILSNAEGADLSGDAIIAALPGKPATRKVEAILKDGVAAKDWERLGKGAKGSPFTYRLGFDSRTPTPIGARTESRSRNLPSGPATFAGEPDWTVRVPPFKQHPESQPTVLEASPLLALKCGRASERPLSAGEA